MESGKLPNYSHRFYPVVMWSKHSLDQCRTCGRGSTACVHEGLQKNLWDYLNKVSWNSALKKSEGDIHLAARYHVAYILRGDMDLYNLPSINAFANNYIQKLRTQGVLD